MEIKKLKVDDIVFSVTRNGKTYKHKVVRLTKKFAVLENEVKLYIEFKDGQNLKQYGGSVWNTTSYVFYSEFLNTEFEWNKKQRKLSYLLNKVDVEEMSKVDVDALIKLLSKIV